MNTRALDRAQTSPFRSEAGEGVCGAWAHRVRWRLSMRSRPTAATIGHGAPGEGARTACWQVRGFSLLLVWGGFARSLARARTRACWDGAAARDGSSLARVRACIGRDGCDEVGLLEPVRRAPFSPGSAWCR